MDMKMISSFSFEYLDRDDVKCTKIKNDTDFDCFIRINPIPPKRKFTDIFVIKKGTIFIFEYVLDLSKISIYFQADS